MRLPTLVACSLALGCAAAAAAASAAAADPQGTWMVEDKSAQIGIGICGGMLWGIVLWERNPGRDSENPDSSLRGRPTLGIPILLGMRPQGAVGPQTLWRGRIYNAQNGSTYDASIKPVSPDVLHLEGCVLGGLFCGGQDWTRVRAPAASSSAAGAAADICSRVPDLARGTH